MQRLSFSGRVRTAIGSLLMVAIAAAAGVTVGCKGEQDSVAGAFAFRGLSVVDVEKTYPGDEPVGESDGTAVTVRFELLDEGEVPVADATEAMLEAAGIESTGPVWADGPSGRLRVFVIVDGSSEAYADPLRMDAVQTEVGELAATLEAGRPDGYRVQLFEFASDLASVANASALNGPVGTSRNVYDALLAAADEADAARQAPETEARSTVVLLVTSGGDDQSTGTGSASEPYHQATGALRQRGIALHTIELGDGQSEDAYQRRAFDVFEAMGRDGSYMRAETPETIAFAFDAVVDHLLATYVVELNTSHRSGQHSGSLVASRDSREGESTRFSFDAGSAGSVAAAPMGLTAESAGISQIGLRWNAAMDAQLYEIQSRPAGGDDGSWLTFAEGADRFATNYGLLAGSRYEYRVRSINEYGRGPWSDVLNTITVCGEPRGLTVDATGFQSMQVSWNTTPGAQRYELQQRIVPASIFSTVQDSPALDFDVSGLPLETRIEYRVRAINEAGQSAWSQTRFRETAPLPPGNIQTTALDDISMTVAWGAVAGGTDYELEWGPSTTGPWTSTGVSTLREADIDSLLPNTTLYVRVRAVGVTPWSNPVSFQTAPPVPEGLRWVDATSLTISMEWDASPGATSYILERRRTGNGGSWTQVHSGSATNAIDNGLQSATDYDYRVRSVAGVRQSRLSEVVIGRTRYHRPSITRLTIVDDTGLRAEWNQAGAGLTFELQIATSSTGPWSTIYTGPNTMHLETNLAIATVHYFRVRAFDSWGPSDWSTVDWATTTIPHVMNLRLVSSTDTTLELAWDPMTAMPADGYELQLNDGGFATIYTGSAATYTAMGLIPGVSHTFRVRSTHPTAGISQWSLPLTVYTPPTVPEMVLYERLSSTGAEVGATMYGGFGTIEAQTAPSPTGPWTDVIDPYRNLNTLRIYGLSSTSTTYIRLQATGPGGSSGWSEYASHVPVVATPVGLTASDVTGSSVRLDWDPVPGAVQYEVKGRHPVTNKTTSFYLGSATYETVTWPTSDMGYYFFVRAIDANGIHSNWSEDEFERPHFWEYENPGVFGRLYGIWGSSNDDMWVVGEGGAMSHRTSAGWTPQSSGTSADLHDIWGTSPTNIYAVGGTSSSGLIRHYNGSTWTTVYAGSSRLYAIHGSAANHIFAVGENGALVMFDGASWTTPSSGTSSTLHGVYVLSSTNALAVGNNGVMRRYNGTSWTSESSGTTATLKAVQLFADNTAIAGGDQSTMLRYDGSSWSAAPPPSGSTFEYEAIYGESINHFVYYTFRYTPANPTEALYGNIGLMYGMHGFSMTNLWACGANGRVRRYTP